MLDDLTTYHRVDKSDTLGIAKNEPDQLTLEFDIKIEAKDFLNVVYAGMGGSALAAALSQSWPGYRVPFVVVRDYELPPFAGEKTLLIVASYSGNTEETLSVLAHGERLGCTIVVIAAGGRLVELAKEKNYPLALLPQTKQPRYAVFANLAALQAIGEAAKIFAQDTKGVLANAVDFLKQAQAAWQPEVPTNANPAKRLSLEALGKSVVVYSGPKIAPAAYKWKISFNENAKQIAWQGIYSEFNHNEFIGWSEQPPHKPYAIFTLVSDFEQPRIRQRVSLSAKLLSGRWPEPFVVQLKGEDLIQQLLYAVLLGDYVSLYCAIAAGNNPEPVELVEKFKQQLAEKET